MKKRGLSAVVTTLIIILLVLVAIGVVWVVISNLITEGADEIDLGKLTINLEIKSVQIKDDGTIDVQIKRNPGEGELTGINILIFDGVKTEVIKQENLVFEELGEKTFNLNYSGQIEKISIAPVLESESGKETLGTPIEKEGFAVFRNDDNEMDFSRYGDATDDGVNKWINVSLKTSKDYYLWTYGAARSCNSTAEDNFRLKVNDDLLQVINFNWCDMFGLDTGDARVSSNYEWKKFKIPSIWIIEGENKFNFYEVTSTCSYLCANWGLGFDTDTDNGMSAWSSNYDPACQPIRGTNPLRQDGSCYNEELMMFLTQ